ncbi:hypothetical protein [Balneatrix alpica]|uniref:Lipoprotein n=1 Tax=Balneatrix alpica TaxID=75684 RepID=A0ABV5ZE34_9GAMM|nr:hypothetical protein [Balneatrix alpica]
MTNFDIALLRFRLPLALLATLLLSLLLGGCQTLPQPRLQNLAKSDVDMIADAYIDELEALTRELTVKLYKRNPKELRKHPQMSLERRLGMLFRRPRILRFYELEMKTGTQAVELAFDPAFKGDRVFALMSGINGMLDAAYGNRTEFFLLDSLDDRALYQSARNLEIILWRLHNKLGPDGQPWLLSTSLDPDHPNLSFERLFGKMIALQDMMAVIGGGGVERGVNRAIQSLATATLFPLGI